MIRPEPFFRSRSDRDMPEPYSRGDQREAFLDAALRLLDANGPDALTLRALAREAGVSHTVPAKHFGHRSDLLTAVAIRLFRDLARRIERRLKNAAARPRERVGAFAEAFIRFGLAAPNRYRLLWRRDLLDPANEELASAMDTLYGRLIAEIATLNPATAFDHHSYAIALWSMVHGYIGMRADGMFVPLRDQVSGEPRERAIVGLMLETLAPRTARAKSASGGAPGERAVPASRNGAPSLRRTKTK